MLRNATSSDWDNIKAIYIEGMNTNSATFEVPGNLKDYSYWMDSRIADACFVLELEGKVVGWSSLSPVSSRCVYSGVAEVSVYVDPRAQRKGVGSRLLGALVEYAENNNIWTLQAGVFPDNESSIALHQKFKFRKIGYREKIGKRNNVWRDNIILERRSTTIL